MPVGIHISRLGGNPPFIYLVTQAFASLLGGLTPIGHQSNTLVMGPGGYRFSDYWQMGLPLTLIVALVAVPLIMRFWPLFSP